MSKHLKILTSVLFIVIIILAVCITRFYFDVSKDTGKNTDNVVTYSRKEQSVNGLYIIESENGLFGVADENNKIILEPCWKSIEIENENFFIVSSDFFGDEILYGCVDSEGNAEIPFIYSGFEKFGTDNMTFYVGRITGENSCIVYDSNFNSCFGRVWDSYSIDENRIKLYWNENAYTYFAGDDGISLKNAVIKNKAMNKKYSIIINSRVLLSKLDYRNLEKISDCISAYLNYSFTQNHSYMDKYISSEIHQDYRRFFSDNPDVVSKKLESIKDVSVYQEKLRDGTQCITASVRITAGISYIRDGENIDLTDNYHAVVKFDEKEFGMVNMISASFSDDEIKSDSHQS